MTPSSGHDKAIVFMKSLQCGHTQMVKLTGSVSIPKQVTPIQLSVLQNKENKQNPTTGHEGGAHLR